jgi:hypothetical protein
MSDIEMFHVGQNEDGEKLYNLRYVKGGRPLPTPSMTREEAFAKINGEEAPIISIDSFNNKSSKDYKSMNKKELELFMREHSIELDRRRTKTDLLQQIENFFKEQVDETKLR